MTVEALPRLRLALLAKVILVEQAVQGTAADPQGPGGMHLVALALLQDGQDVPPLNLVQVLRLRLASGSLGVGQQSSRFSGRSSGVMT